MEPFLLNSLLSSEDGRGTLPRLAAICSHRKVGVWDGPPIHRAGSRHGTIPVVGPWGGRPSRAKMEHFNHMTSTICPVVLLLACSLSVPVLRTTVDFLGFLDVFRNGGRIASPNPMRNLSRSTNGRVAKALPQHPGRLVAARPTGRIIDTLF